MQQSLMKKTALFSLIFFIISMGMICHVSAGKVITITDVAQDEVGGAILERGITTDEGMEKALVFQQGEADSSYLRIPLPAGCKADDITIENHYMDKALWILIPTDEKDFYALHSISGNREAVKNGFFDLTEDGIALNLQLTGIYECRTILENENLYISFMAPGEMYDRIVVIDPACGGLETGYESETLKEKDINLMIARKLKAKLDTSDIKVYYTRMDDVDLEAESRAEIGNGVKADMYIRIEVSSSEDSSVYGIEAAYNEDYFIPGFGNVELADYLEREVDTSVKGKALGLVEAEEDSVLRQIRVPAAVIKVGYISNAQESILLGREEYAEKIATGIYNAILKVYEEKNIG